MLCQSRRWWGDNDTALVQRFGFAWLIFTPVIYEHSYNLPFHTISTVNIFLVNIYLANLFNSIRYNSHKHGKGDRS